MCIQFYHVTFLCLLIQYLCFHILPLFYFINILKIKVWVFRDEIQIWMKLQSRPDLDEITVTSRLTPTSTMLYFNKCKANFNAGLVYLFHTERVMIHALRLVDFHMKFFLEIYFLLFVFKQAWLSGQLHYKQC